MPPDNIIKKRHTNIEWIKALPREESLKFGEIERRILLYETTSHEKLFIQYPGKESQASAQRKQENIRPWDFRPKLYLPNETEHILDLSFENIWDAIYEIILTLKPTPDSDDDDIRRLAALFHEMSTMTHHELRNTNDFQYQDINTQDMRFLAKGNIQLNCPLLIFVPKGQNYASISNKVKKCKISITAGRGKNKKTRNFEISLDAFLLYNELLAWNEDCKFFYRDEIVNAKSWKGQVGRENTLLTYAKIIGYFTGDVRFSTILQNMSRNRGVCPATKEEIGRIYRKFLS